MPISKAFSHRTRANNIRELRTQPLDVLVVGGGIVGAGVVRDLALNGGLRVGLIEQGDFANGTSNATSELVHGGFRYLLKRDLALVKEARQEREVLLQIAPNLVKPLPIAILSYQGEPYPLIGIHVAGLYYNHLFKAATAEKAYALRKPQAIQERLGPVQTAGLKGCVVIWDSTVDDARLTLLTIKSAARHDALVANYVRFCEFCTVDGSVVGARAEDVLTGEQFVIRAKKVVVATGPWIDAIWEQDPCYDGRHLLTRRGAKGSHIIVPRLSDSEYGVLAFTHSEGQRRTNPRILFILPYAHGLSMIGTTESDPEDVPDRVRPSAEEIAYLIKEARRVFPNASLDASRVVAAYAGVRPLVAADTQGFVSREHMIYQSESSVIYVYGGKLTTYRRIGEEAGDLIAAALGVPRHCSTAQLPLIEPSTPPTNFSTGSCESLHERYGAEAMLLEEVIHEDATLAQPLIENLPFLKAEVVHACRHEMALTLEDFLWRRTRIGLTPGQGVQQAIETARLMARENGWTDDRLQSEVTRYEQRLQWLNAALERQELGIRG